MAEWYPFNSGLSIDQIGSEGSFTFTVVEDDGENVTIEISAEDYQRERAAGVDEEDSLLKPGRYKMKRGGFMARHTKLKPQERKRA
ncbi:MAG: hypothetical protein JO360_19100 [Acidobacteria bacterium]|nr:hypothetical protein [Acidobacteriota bacterium]